MMKQPFPMTLFLLLVTAAALSGCGGPDADTVRSEVQKRLDAAVPGAFRVESVSDLKSREYVQNGSRGYRLRYSARVLAVGKAHTRANGLQHLHRHLGSDRAELSRLQQCAPGMTCAFDGVLVVMPAEDGWKSF